MNISIENNMLRLLCQTISVRPFPRFIDFFLSLVKFKVQSAGAVAKQLWRNKGKHCVISGVVSVSYARRQDHYCAPTNKSCRIWSEK